ncbi:MAG TPA: AtpZ/AtpI family protein [Rhizomicrobium sp.]|jgi:ATP synthase protein I
MPAPEPDDLRALGERLDKARNAGKPRNDGPPVGAMGVAFRFATELAVALFVGAGLGWLADHWLHTAPIFIVIGFCLGAAAGIRNVMQAAKELNADAAASKAAPAVNDDDKET